MMSEFAVCFKWSSFVILGITLEHSMSNACLQLGCSLCPIGWTTFGNSCYLHVDLPLTYQKSENYCNTLSPSFWRSHLTSVTTLKEAYFLTDLVRNNSAGTVRRMWIGYDDLITEGMFVWKDGSESKWENWRANDNPDNYKGIEHCVEMFVDDNPEGQWNDIKCSKRMRFVCKLVPLKRKCVFIWSYVTKKRRLQDWQQIE